MEKKGIISLLTTRYSLLAIFVTIATLASAQEVKMKDVFSNAPDSIFPYLTRNNRLDMIDFRESSMKAEVANVLEGKSVLDTLTADYLHLTLNASTIVEMKLLSSSRLLDDTTKTIVCISTTYCGTESNVEFYTSKWHRLPMTLDYDRSSLIARPDTMSLDNYAELVRLAGNYSVVAKLSPLTTDIELSPAFSNVSNDEGKRLEAIKRKISLIYHIDDLKFLNK